MARSSPGDKTPSTGTHTVSVRSRLRTSPGLHVGGRQDLAETIAFAAEGKVHAHIHKTTLENVNHVFTGLKAVKVDGRMMITF